MESDCAFWVGFSKKQHFVNQTIQFLVAFLQDGKITGNVDDVRVCRVYQPPFADMETLCKIYIAHFKKKIDEFRPIICGSTRLSSSTLTTLWRNSWSITWQMHEKLTSFCFNTAWLEFYPETLTKPYEPVASIVYNRYFTVLFISSNSSRNTKFSHSFESFLIFPKLYKLLHKQDDWYKGFK